MGLGGSAVAAGGATRSGSQVHSLRRAPNRLTLSVQIASTAALQDGAGGIASRARSATKGAVLAVVGQSLPGAKVAPSHSRTAMTTVRVEGADQKVWQSSQTVTVTVDAKQQAALDGLRDNLSRMEGVKVASTVSSMSSGLAASALKSAEQSGIKALRRRAGKGASLVALSLGQQGQGQMQRSRGMESGLESVAMSAPAESFHGDNSVTASVNGTWQSTGVLPARRLVQLSETSMNTATPDRGGIKLSAISEGDSSQAAVEAHNAKWAQVVALVRQHLGQAGKGFEVVGDSAMRTQEPGYNRPSYAASQQLNLRNVDLRGKTASLYALRNALADMNVSVELTSGLSATRYRAAQRRGTKKLEVNAEQRAASALAAAGETLNGAERDVTIPSQNNEGHLNVSAGQGFSVAIPVQTSASFQFGIK